MFKQFFSVLGFVALGAGLFTFSCGNASDVGGSTNERCSCAGASNQSVCSEACSASGGQGNTGGSLFGSAGTGGTENTGTGGTGGNASNSLASGLAISEISAWQGVKVPLVKDGAVITQTNAPLVRERDLLLRVYAAPAAGWQPRNIRASLELNGAQYESTVQISAASSDAELGSSFNFAIPKAEVSASLDISVTLYETAAGSFNGSQDQARFPAAGSQSFSTRSGGGPMRVVLVPIQVGSYLPTTGVAQVASYRERLSAMYPVTDMEFSVRAPVSYGGNVSANGNGWSSVLNAIYNLRQQDNAPATTYYYGLLSPAASAVSFCSAGCVAGLSGMPTASDDYQRGAIGLGHFPDGSELGAADTMAHELGHALGRPHTQCGTGENGSGFPYTNGKIGVWGYDISRKRVMSPTTYSDVLGYCNPNWLSDYNFGHLFNRLAAVHGASSRIILNDINREPGAFMTAAVDADGRLVRGEDIVTRSPVLGEAGELELFDGQGRPLGEVTGYYHPAAEAELGGIWLIPKRAASSFPAAAQLRSQLSLGSASIKPSSALRLEELR